MDANQSYSPGPTSWVKINVGTITEVEVKNIVRELRRIWQYLDNVKPKAEIKVTRDGLGQYHVYLNGRALMYLLLFCKNIEPYELLNEKRAAEVPMPPNFLLPD